MAVLFAQLTMLASGSATATQPAAESHDSAHALLFIVGLCIVSATVLAYVAKTLRQPLLLAYIAAGILIGPIGLKWVGEDQRATIEALATLGLAFLMFIVGMEIDVRKLLALGWPVTIMTVVQVVGCAVIGWAASLWLLGPGMPAVYMGLVIAFSSTMIVVKLLSDRNELDTLPGRLTLGVLLFEDVMAILVLAIQPSFGEGFHLTALVIPILKGLGLVAGALLISRYVLPIVFRWVAMSPEALLLSAITWCFIVSFVAIKLGLSEAMGAMIAGVSIGSYPYALEVTAKLRSLRDFFVTLFFVTLGLLLTTPTWSMLGAALVLTILVAVARTVTVWPVAKLLGYGHRVGILNSIHRAQISEFGLIIILLGLTLGHFGDRNSEGARSMVTITVVLLVASSMLSTYLIIYSHPIAAWIMRFRIFKEEPIAGAHTKPGDEHGHAEGEAHAFPAKPIIVVGCFRIGSSLVHELHRVNMDFSVIDFNPRVRAELQAMGVPCLYGDISYYETLWNARIDKAKVVISAIPDDFLRGTSNEKLMAAFRRINPEIRVILTSESIQQALHLYNAGADYVIVPRVLAAERLIGFIAGMESNQLLATREDHIAQLKKRREVVA